MQQFVIEVVDRRGAIWSCCGVGRWIPDRTMVCSAERERARNANRAERVEPVSVCECLVLESRPQRIPGPSGLPVMVLDTGRDRTDLVDWEPGSGEDFGCERRASLRVLGAPGGVPNIVQQSSGFHDVCVGANGKSNLRT